MNWDAIGAVGEIVGALAVFLTLVYLALQIRQNTSAVRASALDSSITAVGAIRQAVFSSSEVADIYLRGLASIDNLDQVERDRFRLILNNILWSLWNVYSQASYAGLSTSTWESQRTLIGRILTTPGGQWFWSSYSEEFEQSFREEVDGIVEAMLPDPQKV